MVISGYCDYAGTGGAPRQSASEPPVSCCGHLESPAPASAAAMLPSHEPQSNMMRIMQLCRGTPPVLPGCYTSHPHTSRMNREILAFIGPVNHTHKHDAPKVLEVRRQSSPEFAYAFRYSPRPSNAPENPTY